MLMNKPKCCYVSLLFHAGPSYDHGSKHISNFVHLVLDGEAISEAFQNSGLIGIWNALDVLQSSVTGLVSLFETLISHLKVR